MRTLRDRALGLIGRSQLAANSKTRAGEQLRSSLRITTTPRSDAKLALGTSKLGGAPDLASPRPALGFVAQINLGYVADRGVALPPAGLLSFFFDLTNEPFGFDPSISSCSVVYTPPGSALARAPSDEGLAPCALAFHEEVGLPPLDSSDVLEIVSDLLPDGEGGRYLALVEAVRDLGFGGQTFHRLGGQADPLQGNMQLECQLVANGIHCGSPAGYSDPRVAELASGAREWRLLLQVDTDDAIEWSFADAGRLYFWIRESDLIASRFDRVRAILQSH